MDYEILLIMRWNYSASRDNTQERTLDVKVMVEEDVDEHYESEEQPWWANDYLIFILTLANIGIIIYDLEYHSDLDIFDIYANRDMKWLFLALADLILIGFFVADLYEDYQRCIDKEWWWKTHWWEFLGLIPLAVTAIPFLASLTGLRLLRLFRAFSGVLRLIGMSRRRSEVSVQRQVLHLITIVLVLIVAGGFFVYIFESQQYEEDCLIYEDGQGELIDGAPKECGRMVHEFSNALWWAIVTTTTVGYGEYAPVNPWARLIAACLMLIGIGLVGTLAATMSQLFYTMREGTGERSLVNTDQDVLGTMTKLLKYYEKGFLDRENFEGALTLAMKRIRAEIVMLREEFETQSRMMPVPMQVAKKMEFGGKLTLLEDMLHDVEALLPEEE